MLDQVVQLLLQGATNLIGMARRSKTAPENLLNHATRRRIVDLVSLQPGANLKRIRDRLGSNRGTVAHHVRLLEEGGILKGRVQGREHQCYLEREPDVGVDKLAVLQEGRTMEIIDAVIARPGIVQRELASQLGMSRKVIRGRLDALKATQLLEERPDSRWRKYFPTATLESILRDINGRKGHRP